MFYFVKTPKAPAAKSCYRETAKCERPILRSEKRGGINSVAFSRMNLEKKIVEQKKKKKKLDILLVFLLLVCFA